MHTFCKCASNNASDAPERIALTDHLRCHEEMLDRFTRKSTVMESDVSPVFYDCRANVTLKMSMYLMKFNVMIKCM